MEQHKQDSANIIVLFFKFGFGILVGLMGRVSYDLSIGRKLSIWAWMGITGISVFAGYISAICCDIYKLDNASKVIVPLVTLFGEKITSFIFLKFSDIMKDWFLDNLDSIKKRITGGGKD